MHDYDGSTTINAPIAHVAAQFPGDVKAEWFGGMASCVDLDVIADQPTAVSQQPAGPFKVYEDYHLPCCFKNRDYMLTATWTDGTTDDGKKTTTLDIHDTEDERYPTDNGKVRGTLTTSLFKLIEVDATTTRVELRVNVHPNGNIGTCCANIYANGFPPRTLGLLKKQSEATKGKKVYPM